MKYFASFMLLIILASNILATEVANTTPEFKFLIPVGFKEKPIDSTWKQKPAYQYSNGNMAKGGLTVVVTIRDRELEQSDGKEIAAGKFPNCYLEAWKEFQIPANKEEKDPTVLLQAYVPIKGRAVGIVVIGKKEKLPEIEKVFKEVLATIDGPTNWKVGYVAPPPPAPRSPPQNSFPLESIGFGIALLVAIIFAIYARITNRTSATATPPPASSGTPSASTASSAETPGRNDSGT